MAAEDGRLAGAVDQQGDVGLAARRLHAGRPCGHAGRGQRHSGGALAQQALHIGGYCSCAGLQTQEQLAWIEALRAIGVKLITCDPQHDSSEKWRGKDNHLLRLLERIDVFLPNEMEAMGVSGAGSPQEALNLLTNRYPNLLVVVKIGAGGVMAGRGKQEWAVRGYDDIECVDTTGAGDAFNAGFLHRYVLDPKDVEAALRDGCAAGALCVAMAGACPTPIEGAAVERLVAA